jgi:hypothetical protein
MRDDRMNRSAVNPRQTAGVDAHLVATFDDFREFATERFIRSDSNQKTVDRAALELSNSFCFHHTR